MTKKYFVAILIISILMLFAVALATFYAFKNLNETKSVKDELIFSYTTMGSLLATLEDAETGERGYVITGDETYLQPYRAATTYLELPALKNFFRAQETLSLQNEFKKLTLQIQELTLQIARVIDMRTKGSFDVAKSEIVKGQGKYLMDEIRKNIESIQLNQRTLFFIKDREVQEDIEILLFIMLSGNIIALCLIGGCFFFIHRETKKILLMDKSLSELGEWQSAILNSINQAIITLDFNGDILSYSQGAESILGYNATEMLGKSILKLFDNTNNVEVLHELSRKMGVKIYNPLDLIQHLSREGYTHHQITWQVRRKDKSLFYLLSTVIPLTDSENKITGTLFIGSPTSPHTLTNNEAALSSHGKHDR